MMDTKELFPFYLSPTKGRPWIEIDFPEELEKARKEVFPALKRKYSK